MLPTASSTSPATTADALAPIARATDASVEAATGALNLAMRWNPS
jgi:hypothetical protein